MLSYSMSYDKMVSSISMLGSKILYVSSRYRIDYRFVNSAII